MNLYIPSIKDKIRLTRDWHFVLFLEYRNIPLAVRLRPMMKTNRYAGVDKSIMAKLPAGTELTIERIYIRSGKKEFDSITFFVNRAPGDENYPPLKKRGCGWQYTDASGTVIKLDPQEYGFNSREEGFVPAPSKQVVQLAGGRFWAKLDDVNTIECEKIEKIQA